MKKPQMGEAVREPISQSKTANNMSEMKDLLNERCDGEHGILPNICKKCDSLNNDNSPKGVLGRPGGEKFLLLFIIASCNTCQTRMLQLLAVSVIRSGLCA